MPVFRLDSYSAPSLLTAFMACGCAESEPLDRTLLNQPSGQGAPTAQPEFQSDTCLAQASGECDSSPRATSGNAAPPVIVENDPPPLPVDLDEKCIEVVSGFQKVIPTVLLLVDRSGSMAATFDPATMRSRWQTVQDTLADPNAGIVKTLQTEVRFGLALYTSVANENDPTQFEQACPTLVETPIGLNNFEQIADTLDSTELMLNGRGHPTGETPTSESVRAATETLLGFPEEGPKALVLATDGDPDNCMNANDNLNAAQDRTLSQEMSVEAVEDAFSQGIRTYVIAVGDDVTQTHLEELAQAGLDDPAAEPYSALTTAQLEDAFTEILGQERSCSYPLQGEVPDFHLKNGSVMLGAEVLAFGDPDGWTVVRDPETMVQSVILQGGACEASKNSQEDVSITFPCIYESQVPK